MGSGTSGFASDGSRLQDRLHSMFSGIMVKRSNGSILSIGGA